MGRATQLGHKRPGTTETYTAFHPDDLKDAAKALDNLVRAAADAKEICRCQE